MNERERGLTEVVVLELESRRRDEGKRSETRQCPRSTMRVINKRTHSILLVDLGSNRRLGSFGSGVLLPESRAQDVEVKSRSVSIVEPRISLVGVDLLLDLSSSSDTAKWERSVSSAGEASSSSLARLVTLTTSEEARRTLLPSVARVDGE